MKKHRKENAQKHTKNLIKCKKRKNCLILTLQVIYFYMRLYTSDRESKNFQREYNIDTKGSIVIPFPPQGNFLIAIAPPN